MVEFTISVGPGGQYLGALPGNDYLYSSSRPRTVARGIARSLLERHRRAELAGDFFLSLVRIRACYICLCVFVLVIDLLFQVGPYCLLPILNIEVIR